MRFKDLDADGRRAYYRAYSQKPEQVAYRAAQKQDPRVMARRTAASLKYSQKPEQRIKQAEMRCRPGYKEYIDPIRRKNQLRRYGLSPEGYASLLEKQGNCCAVCKATEAGSKRSRYFDVDHDHVSGIVRGLLCRKCNVTAGVLERNRERVALLEAYLSTGGVADGKCGSFRCH